MAGLRGFGLELFIEMSNLMVEMLFDRLVVLVLTDLPLVMQWLWRLLVWFLAHW